jgi:hypothetical protein
MVQGQIRGRITEHMREIVIDWLIEVQVRVRGGHAQRQAASARTGVGSRGLFACGFFKEQFSTHGQQPVLGSDHF